jgi:hypothetical protein
LIRHTVKQGSGARFTDPVLKRPDRGAVRNVADLRESAWFYGTALPLAFYVKQAAFNPCGAEAMSITAEAQRLRFSVFLLTGAPLFAVGCLMRDRINLVLLSSVVAFEAYHLALTLDIMGMHGRYYVPALPLLAVAAARALKARPKSSTRFVLAVALAVPALGVAAAGWFPGDGAGCGHEAPRQFQSREHELGRAQKAHLATA